MDTKHWVEPPNRRQALEFLEEVKQTNRPEDHPWISDDPVDPKNPNLRHQIIVRVELDDKLRNSNLIPCALCQIPKFYIGRLLWSSDGKLRLVGKDCAAHHFPDWAQYESDYVSQIKEVAYRQALVQFLPQLVPCIEYVESLRDACRHFGRGQQALRNSVPGFVEALRSSLRGRGGALVVETGPIADNVREYMGRNALRGNDGRRFETVAVIRGSSYLEEGYSAHEQRLTVLKDLNYLHRLKGNAATHGQIAKKVEHLTGRALSQTAKRLHGAAECTVELHRRLTEMASFLSVRNFHGIKAWAEHPLHPEPFEVEVGRRIAWVKWDRQQVGSFELGAPSIDPPNRFLDIQRRRLIDL